MTGNKKFNSGWLNVVQKSLRERWTDKVQIAGSNECWLWTGKLSPFGYGVLRSNYKDTGAHRVSYELNVGPIPKGQHVLHKCDNPKCVNPNHLFLGTQADNMKDMFAKGRNRNQYSTGGSRKNGRDTIVEALTVEGWVQYQNMTEAAKSFGVSVSKVSLAARGLRKKAGGVQWRIAATT